MYKKLRTNKMWLPACVGLVGLFLRIGQVQAAECVNEIAAGCQLSPNSAVHIGDTITITLVKSSSSAGDCSQSNVIAFIVKPNGNTQLAITNAVFPGGACFESPINLSDCPLGVGVALPFNP